MSSAPPAVTPLVLTPAFTFDELEARLSASGWSAQPSNAATSPLIPGEPEFASWRKGTTLLSYSFNPVVRLRVLTVTGSDGHAAHRELMSALPWLDASDIRTLLREDDPRSLILGALAAAELDMSTLLPDLQPLQEHPERHVAAAARHAAERLGRAIFVTGFERLAYERARRPDRSALFPRLGNAVTRRQAIRSIPRTTPPGDGAVAMLRSALADEDWEVRASAMILAAELCPGTLALEVRRLQLPVTGYPRPFKTHLDALRAIARRYPDLSAMPAPVYRAFTTPQSATTVASQVVNAITFYYVPAGSYHIGCVDDFAEVNPYRVVDTAGFWISNPVGAAADRSSIRVPSGTRLPASIEWEIAMRGVDARLFPWGNSLVRPPDHAVSWCGVTVRFDDLPEWTSDDLCAGAFHDARCAARQRPLVGTRHHFRLVRD
jgi:hypothetical protein